MEGLQPSNRSDVFHLRTVFADDGRFETSTFDLDPALDEGRMVCNLFADFLSRRPMEFREKLSFLKKGDLEMEWAAAAGGAAFTAFVRDGEALGMGVLLAGLDEASDAQMLAGLRETILEPMIGARTAECLSSRDRPLAILLVMPDHAEMIPTLQLLMTALGSVYFRAIFELHRSSV
jgi:hypothetical protein